MKLTILYNECLNIGNKVFIKQYNGGLTDDIEDLPKNTKLIIEVKNGINKK